MLKKYKQLEYKIQLLKEQIKSLPEGSLSCAHNQNRYKWYHCHNNLSTYIPKSKKDFAQQLALKKYLHALLHDLSQEKRAIQFYLDHHCNNSSAEEILTHPEFMELLSEHFKPSEQELADWVNAPYEHNLNHPEHLIYKSCSGNLVRSKSESIIDILLYTHKIPFRYECALQLDNVTLFPDFTLRHPVTGDIFYWEHFGKMDNPSYVQKTYSKLQLYTSHNIVPSIQLITTYETKENPLTPDIVEKVINHYFEQ